MSQPLERRQFLQYLAGLGVAGLTACTTPPPPRSPGKPVVALPTQPPQIFESIPPLPPLQRLTKDIQSLPPSLVKDSLVERVLPLYQQKPPFFINVAGVDILIYNHSLVERRDHSERGYLNGTFSFRLEVPKTIHTLEYPQTLMFPVSGLLTEEEKATLPAMNIAPDGTPLSDINFGYDSEIGAGLAPEIIVRSSRYVTRDSQRVMEDLITWGYVKEACSALLGLLRLEISVRKMQELGHSPFLKAIDRQGNSRSVEGISETFSALAALRGRFLASWDLQGYAVSLKALRESNVFNTLQSYGANLSHILPSVDNLELGTSEDSMYFNSMAWALHTPEARDFSHQGTMVNFP